MISQVISAWSVTWLVYDHPHDQCMGSHVISAWLDVISAFSVSRSVHDSHVISPWSVTRWVYDHSRNHDKSATYFFMIAFSFIFLSFLSSQAIPFSFWCIVFTLPYPNGEKWIDYSVYNLRIPFFFCTFWSLGIPGYPGVNRTKRIVRTYTHMSNFSNIYFCYEAQWIFLSFFLACCLQGSPH